MPSISTQQNYVLWGKKTQINIVRYTLQCWVRTQKLACKNVCDRTQLTSYRVSFYYGLHTIFH